MMRWNSNFITHQGRKWLPKTGWASSNVAHLCHRAAARRRLLFCQKLGGQLPTLPTHHLRPCSLLAWKNFSYPCMDYIKVGD